MLFKLATKNIKKNMKDYVIYFLTLVLGVAIFYIFNSMDSQQAMLDMSDSKRQIVELMLEALGIVSVFVSIVLAFLILYANNFLIKRRNKEFGLYMLLGMGKRQISGILLLETILIGVFSLVVGIIVGIFGSQLMSILVAKLFEANMTKFEFIFSQVATIKTVVYFGIIYGIVAIVNLFKTSKYKLIDLINATRKNENVKIKNPVISVILFMVSMGILGMAYYLAVDGMGKVEIDTIIIAIGLGIIGTFFFFYSLAGFILKLVQMKKSFYQKNLNMFVVKQINSKVNSTVFSMGIICLLLFLTICIFSSAISLNNTMTKQIKDVTPVDISVAKYQNLTYEGDTKEDINKSIIKLLEEVGINKETTFSEYAEINTYVEKGLTIQSIFKQDVNDTSFYGDFAIAYIKLSDYNKIAELYGKEKMELAENEYELICNVEDVIELYNKELVEERIIQISGNTLKNKSTKCINSLIQIAQQPMESGTIIVPDKVVQEENIWRAIFNANYKGKTEEEKQKIEKFIIETEKENYNMSTEKNQVFNKLIIDTKINIYESVTSLSATVTFIGLYLGITFLISSAAILALKELSDSSDNKQRYDILRKIGADEKMINKALFWQIGIFFIMPLLLACIHSIFGIKVAGVILNMFGKQDIVSSIIATAIFMVVIYGGYFIATYFGSKNIIKEKV